MADGSMAKPANEGTDHNYWNKQTMSTTLLPLIMSIINCLGEEVSQHQNTSGDLVLNLLRITLHLTDVTLQLRPNIGNATPASLACLYT